MAFPEPPDNRFRSYPLRSSTCPVAVPKRSVIEQLPRGVPQPESGLLGKRVFDIMQSENASSYADVTLICPDGPRFSAMRMIVAMSSSYFEKLLTSDFAEKKLSEISINVSSKMLSQILEFIYTDDCPLLRRIREEEYDSLTLCDITRDLIDLTCAADYTGMERLLSRCESTMSFLCVSYVHLATVVVQATRAHNSAWSKKMYEKALQSASSHLIDSLLCKFDRCNVACGVMHLDNHAAEDIFGLLTKPNCSARMHSFLALVLWASGGTAVRQAVNSTRWDDFEVVENSKAKILNERLETAKKVAGWFDLTEFDPNFLSRVVEASGLVKTDALNKAYKELSLRYHVRLNEEASRKLPRLGPYKYADIVGRMRGRDRDRMGRYPYVMRSDHVDSE